MNLSNAFETTGPEPAASIEGLFTLTEHAKLVKMIAGALHKHGHPETAARFTKLEEDASVQLYKACGHSSVEAVYDADAETGPETARRVKAYTPVTEARLAGEMRGAYALLPEVMKPVLATLMDKVGVQPDSSRKSGMQPRFQG